MRQIFLSVLARITCRSSTDQSSLDALFSLLVVEVQMIRHADSEDSYQTVLINRLILDCAVHVSFEGFAMPQLKREY